MLKAVRVLGLRRAAGTRYFAVDCVSPAAIRCFSGDKDPACECDRYEPWLSVAGPHAAARLAYRSHRARAGAGNQSGQHRPVLSEPHLAAGSDRPDGAHAGNEGIPGC